MWNILLNTETTTEKQSPISTNNLPTPKKHLIGWKEQKKDCVRGAGADGEALWKTRHKRKTTILRFVLSGIISSNKVIRASKDAVGRSSEKLWELLRYSATDFFQSSFNSTSWSCFKNHSRVSFCFFKGGSAIASQDKRLNHLFSTLGTMTMTHKVSAQSVPCHLLFKKKGLLHSFNQVWATHDCSYQHLQLRWKNNLHAIKDERERLHHINRACYCHPLIAFSNLSNCHP